MPLDIRSKRLSDDWWRQIPTRGDLGEISYISVHPITFIAPVQTVRYQSAAAGSRHWVTSNQYELIEAYYKLEKANESDTPLVETIMEKLMSPPFSLLSFLHQGPIHPHC